MNAETFAEWLRRQSYRVIRTESSYWYNNGPRVYQAFPYHQLICPSNEELDRLLRQHRLVGLRYSTPLSAPEGLASYHIVCESHDYQIENLPKKARHDVNKGLAHASVEQISLHDLAHRGWALRLDTLHRQGRAGAEDQTWWRKLCLSAEGLPGFEAWAAIHNGQLVASLLALSCDGCCSILYQQSSSQHLKYGVNNALAYTFTSQALRRPDIARMFYGLHSLDAPASVDEFKLRMGYTVRSVRQRVVFHPILTRFFNNYMYEVIKGIHTRRPNNPALAKAEGLVRFYLQGKLPPSEQHGPEVLSNSTDHYLEGD